MLQMLFQLHPTTELSRLFEVYCGICGLQVCICCDPAMLFVEVVTKLLLAFRGVLRHLWPPGLHRRDPAMLCCAVLCMSSIHDADHLAVALQGDHALLSRTLCLHAMYAAPAILSHLSLPRHDFNICCCSSRTSNSSWMASGCWGLTQRAGATSCF